jgi:hypothetical protein
MLLVHFVHGYKYQHFGKVLQIVSKFMLYVLIIFDMFLSFLLKALEVILEIDQNLICIYLMSRIRILKV